MRLRLLIAALAVLSMGSCIRDPRIPIDQNGKEITFVVSISVSNNNAGTKAIDHFGVDDNEVEEIAILLFDDATGAYRTCIQALEIDTDTDFENIKRFSVLIPSGDYKALFIANAYSKLTDICNFSTGKYVGGTIDMTDADIEDALLYGIGKGEKYNAKPLSSGYRPFYMCSGWVDLQIPFPAGVNYDANPIQLSRDVAKINVIANSVSGVLTLDEIYLCNYTRDGYIVPAQGWWNNPSTRLFAASGVIRQP